MKDTERISIDEIDAMLEEKRDRENYRKSMEITKRRKVRAMKKKKREDIQSMILCFIYVLAVNLVLSAIGLKIKSYFHITGEFGHCYVLCMLMVNLMLTFTIGCGLAKVVVFILKKNKKRSRNARNS